MKPYRKASKKSKIINIALLISLVNILFPQTAASQTNFTVPEKARVIKSSPKNATPLEKDITGSFKYLPIAPDKKPKRTFYLTVTAYSSTPDQTSGDPFITASGERVQEGTLAYNYLPFGTKVRFPEVFPKKSFIIKDRLPEGASVYLADMWVPTREEAKQWGAKILKIEVF